MSPSRAILVINCGSSSLKFAVFGDGPGLPRVLSGAVDRIGTGDSRLLIRQGHGVSAIERFEAIPDHRSALERVLETLEKRLKGPDVHAIGHRIVHGGAECDCPLPVTAGLEQRLRDLIPLAPLHLPHNLAGIAAVRAVRPRLAQFASFDTAFHHSLPRLAQLMALPREMHATGIRRYGFHGLSYEYVVEHLRQSGVDLERERIIVAHLGNGASMCALRGGRSVETTMGFSTLAGLMMGTRCGDLDPGVVLYLLKERGLGVGDLETLLYKSSGLLGVSGRASDMSELLEHQGEASAREAVDLFCYVACHNLAALTAALGGLDRLVFTGGIGANAPEVRTRICRNLGYLGISLDAEANSAGRPTISPPWEAVAVDIVNTDEELVIARHTRQLCLTNDCKCSVYPPEHNLENRP